MTRTGINGGLYRVLKTVAEHMAEQYAQNEISARVNEFWENLTVSQRLAAVDEYLRFYGHLLPPEFTDGNAARLKAHFLRVLKDHPKTIRRMRRIGR